MKHQNTFKAVGQQMLDIYLFIVFIIDEYLLSITCCKMSHSFGSIARFCDMSLLISMSI